MPSLNSTNSHAIVYFVQQGYNGEIKIGKTTRAVEMRLKNLQTASPKKLRLLGFIDDPFAQWDEKTLHQMFAHLRVRARSEWFSPAKELVDFIGEYATPPKSALRESQISHGSLPWMPVPMSPTRRDFYRVDRLRHIRVAYLRHVEGIPVKKLASRYRVSVRTIQYWVSAALAYDDSEAETLRRMIDC